MGPDPLLMLKMLFGPNRDIAVLERWCSHSEKAGGYFDMRVVIARHVVLLQDTCHVCVIIALHGDTVSSSRLGDYCYYYLLSRDRGHTDQLTSDTRPRDM